MHKKIIWISSYPKSGNTWVRSIITSLFLTNDGQFSFDLLKKIKYFDIKGHYNFVKDISLTDFENISIPEINYKYRIEAQKNLKLTSGNFTFFKNHSSNLKYHNYDFTDEITTLGSIYVIRDPRDVAVSFANHAGVSYDKIIERMTNINEITSSDNIMSLQSSWDNHVNSWTKFKTHSLLLKYEDMIENNHKVLEKMIKFFSTNLKIPLDHKIKIINSVVKSTSFAKLKDMETKEGFEESMKQKDKPFFFRKGETNQWKNILSLGQVKKIEQSFNKTMIQFGYL